MKKIILITACLLSYNTISPMERNRTIQAVEKIWELQQQRCLYRWMEFKLKEKTEYSSSLRQAYLQAITQETEIIREGNILQR